MDIETLNLINKFNIEEFNYKLPKENIAEYPLQKRSDSKLLLANINKKNIGHYNFKDIPSIIPLNSVLILNDSKVIPARIFFKKETGGIVEIFNLEPIKPSTDPQISLLSKNNTTWKCFVGGRNIKPILNLKSVLENDIDLNATIISRNENEAEVEFKWKDGNFTFLDILEKFGNIPLPPYISRNTELIDLERYQTIFANNNGSVAAPTAGLHFTEEIISEIINLNIPIEKLTLHVGAGTFKPVSNDNISVHKMHSEMFSVSKIFLENIYIYLRQNKKIISTGTTSLRTLESIYWCGIKLIKKINTPFILSQWESYYLDKDFDNNIDLTSSMEAIIEYLDRNKLERLIGNTQLFILPNYKFKMASGLITNFHLPKSTLIMLVAAFTGGDYWRNIYKTALENNYRFLSYGDCSLLIK